MPQGRKPSGDRTLTGAERQARYRARHPGAAIIRYRRPVDRRSRPQRWHEAVAELVALQADYAHWLDALPDATRDGAADRRAARRKSASSPPPRTPPPAARPGGCTATPHARRSVAREGTARRARVPSMHYLDDPLPPSPAGTILDAKRGSRLNAN